MPDPFEYPCEYCGSDEETEKAACNHTLCAQCSELAECPVCEEERLPTIEEMSGSIPNITGGLSLTEYMDSIRGAYLREEERDVAP